MIWVSMGFLLGWYLGSLPYAFGRLFVVLFGALGRGMENE